MKAIEEMSYTELKEEIQYIVSIMDDDAQARHHAVQEVHRRVCGCRCDGCA